MSMIKTENLKKCFSEFVAVEDINLQVGAGEVLALLGPNGAGKTTTVRLLTSVLKPSDGNAWVAGFDVVTQAADVRANVGVLTENHGLYNRMPAGEYLDFFGQVYHLKDEYRQVRIDEILERFGLIYEKNKRIGEFSKGMRQKLALARALLHSPPVLLLDEPTSAMDPESSRLVRDSIQNLRSEERAIVICTHNLVEAEALADRIAIIRKGHIIANGTVEALKNRFLGPPEFDVHFGIGINGDIKLPVNVNLIDRGINWIRFATQDPEINNPLVIETLVEQKLPILGMTRNSRSLEQVYLEVIKNAKIQEASIV